MYFNTEDGSFRANFIFDASVEKPTELYMNAEQHYPDGFEIYVEVEGESEGWTFQQVSIGKENE